MQKYDCILDFVREFYTMEITFPLWTNNYDKKSTIETYLCCTTWGCIQNIK